MKKFLITTLTAAALCFAPIVSYSGNNSDHEAIANKFESLFGAKEGTGLIVQTQEDGRLGATVIGIDTDTNTLCTEFRSVAPLNYVILSQLDGRYAYRACD